MLAALVLAAGETFEAGFVIGVIWAATRNIPGRGLWAAFGVVGGGIAAMTIELAIAHRSPTAYMFFFEIMITITLSLSVLVLIRHVCFLTQRAADEIADVRVGWRAKIPLGAVAIAAGSSISREGLRLRPFSRPS